MQATVQCDRVDADAEEPPGPGLARLVHPIREHLEHRGPHRHTHRPFEPSLPPAPDRRFYQAVCAPFPQEPTRDRLAVVASEAVGEGLMALTDFAPGDVVFTFAGSILPYQTLFTLQIAPGRYIEDPLVMGKVLHSCDPNMVCSMGQLTFWAIKPIRAGEYLYMDYESTEDELYRHFDCCCGAPACRGRIRGRRYLTAAERSAILDPSCLTHVRPR
jgi:hypothetical protein